jgi:uncharacterized protein (DUF58 family)
MEPDREIWTPTRALRRGVFVAGIVLVAAIVMGRLDLVILAAPFAIGTAASLRRRPTMLPRLRVHHSGTFVSEGAPVELAVTVGNPDSVPMDLVVVRTRLPHWLKLRDADRPFAITVGGREQADIPFEGEAKRWGRHVCGPAVAHAVACDGLLVSSPAVGRPVSLKVYPLTDSFDATDALPRAAGISGVHHSRRLGEGGELAGIRPFGPGDRLRRIDWRVTLRTQQLHVASTFSDRDAEIVLLLDVMAEAGVSGGLGGSASVLDITVRAAAGIAEHYLGLGDRVALSEYGFRSRRLRAAAGRRQHQIVLEWLLDTKAVPTWYEPGSHVFGPHLFSANALIVVLTPLLDERSAGMVARFARAGRSVIAVDTLPPRVVGVSRSIWSSAARRLWFMERENTIGQLREHGVPVVRWAGAGSLDQVLRDVSRMAGAARIAR